MRRLRYLRTVVHDGDVALVALLEPWAREPAPWAAEVLLDLRVLAEHCPELAGLGDPGSAAGAALYKATRPQICNVGYPPYPLALAKSALSALSVGDGLLGFMQRAG